MLQCRHRELRYESGVLHDTLGNFSEYHNYMTTQFPSLRDVHILSESLSALSQQARAACQSLPRAPTAKGDKYGRAAACVAMEVSPLRPSSCKFDREQHNIDLLACGAPSLPTDIYGPSSDRINVTYKKTMDLYHIKNGASTEGRVFRGCIVFTDKHITDDDPLPVWAGQVQEVLPVSVSPRALVEAAKSLTHPKQKTEAAMTGKAALDLLREHKFSKEMKDVLCGTFLRNYGHDDVLKGLEPPLVFIKWMVPKEEDGSKSRRRLPYTKVKLGVAIDKQGRQMAMAIIPAGCVRFSIPPAKTKATTKNAKAMTAKDKKDNLSAGGRLDAAGAALVKTLGAATYVVGINLGRAICEEVLHEVLKDPTADEYRCQEVVPVWVIDQLLSSRRLFAVLLRLRDELGPEGKYAASNCISEGIKISETFRAAIQLLFSTLKLDKFDPPMEDAHLSITPTIEWAQSAALGSSLMPSGKKRTCVGGSKAAQDLWNSDSEADYDSAAEESAHEPASNAPRPNHRDYKYEETLLEAREAEVRNYAAAEKQYYMSKYPPPTKQ
jgi:hypothetical protein